MTLCTSCIASSYLAAASRCCSRRPKLTNMTDVLRSSLDQYSSSGDSCLSVRSTAPDAAHEALTALLQRQLRYAMLYGTVSAVISRHNGRTPRRRDATDTLYATAAKLRVHSKQIYHAATASLADDASIDNPVRSRLLSSAAAAVATALSEHLQQTVCTVCERSRSSSRSSSECLMRRSGCTLSKAAAVSAYLEDITAFAGNDSDHLSKV
eukprot:7610-Heterococcus_DN1.PRE.2